MYSNTYMENRHRRSARRATMQTHAAINTKQHILNGRQIGFLFKLEHCGWRVLNFAPFQTIIRNFSLLSPVLLVCVVFYLVAKWQI